jgi:hypothetical protein
VFDDLLIADVRVSGTRWRHGGSPSIWPTDRRPTFRTTRLAVLSFRSRIGRTADRPGAAPPVACLPQMAGRFQQCGAGFLDPALCPPDPAGVTVAMPFRGRRSAEVLLGGFERFCGRTDREDVDYEQGGCSRVRCRLRPSLPSARG